MATRPGYIWSGTEWVSIGQEATVNPFAYQASAPITPATGDIWVDSDDTVPSIDSAQFLRWRKTVAGGETSLSGNDDTSLPLQYTAGYEQLYINGVLQVRTLDYTATTGTTITGLTALALNDVVEIFSVVARLVGDVYTQAQADARYATQATVNALPSAGLTLINTQTLAANTGGVSFTNVFDSTVYTHYRLMIDMITNTGTTYLQLRARLNTTDVTAGYYGSILTKSYNGTLYVPWSTDNQSSFTIMAVPTASASLLGVDIYPTTAKKLVIGGSGFDAGNVGPMISGGILLTAQATPVTGLTIYPSANNITGTIALYGYKKA